MIEILDDRTTKQKKVLPENPLVRGAEARDKTSYWPIKLIYDKAAVSLAGVSVTWTAVVKKR